MKVVCINNDIICEAPQVCCLKKGNIYHVLSEHDVSHFKTNDGKKAEDGIYYKLIETGEYAYHSSLFIKVNETEIDEMQLVNELQIIN